MTHTVFMRLDKYLVEKGLAASRTRAQSLIHSGKVTLNGVVMTSPATPCTEDFKIEVNGNDYPWVGRGGIKLDHGLDAYRIHVENRVAIDVGASTGGFTDVLLQRNVKQVYAVDIGSGHLDQKIRNDPRVIVMEKTDSRMLTPGHFSTPYDLIVSDVSDVSLTEALDKVVDIARFGTELIALIKPQFEVEPQKVTRNGVVKDLTAIEGACEKISGWLQGKGWVVKKLTESPITSGSGNKEFLIFAYKGGR